MRPPNLFLIAVALLAFAFLPTGCGIKAPPQPPIVKTIPPIRDLLAQLSGKTVKISWTPSFNYTDGSQLILRSVAIYRLDEDLNERLEKQAEELRKQQERAEETAIAVPPIGELSLRLQRINRMPATDFRKKAQLVAELRVEQLIDRAIQGKIRWEESLPLDTAQLPTKRSVYALVETDSRGRRSAFSNMVSIIPLAPPSKPTNLSHLLTQQSLTLNWSYPDRNDKGSLQIPLVGFNVYKASEDAQFFPVPVNSSPLPTAPPSEWQASEIISHQQINGSASRFAYLFSTSESPQAAGVSQVLIGPQDIDRYRSMTVEVEAQIRAPLGPTAGRLVLDSSRDPGNPSAEPAGSEIFSEEDNPLITQQQILISEEAQRFTISGKVAVDAKAVVLKIEPRGYQPISSPFIVESVRGRISGQTGSLVSNGDFDGFNPTVYTEPIEAFGGAYRYQVTAVYSLAGYSLESEPTEAITVRILDTFPPDIPQNPNALPTTDAIVVTWTASVAKDIRGYHVFRREGIDGSWKQLNKQPVETTIFRDGEVSPSTDYTYRIQAVDQAGNASQFSAEVSARLVPK